MKISQEKEETKKTNRKIAFQNKMVRINSGEETKLFLLIKNQKVDKNIKFL